MKLYDKQEEFLRSFPTGPPDGISFEIFDALVKTWSKLRGERPYPRIMVALSGGADGDITLDARTDRTSVQRDSLCVL